MRINDKLNKMTALLLVLSMLFGCFAGKMEHVSAAENTEYIEGETGNIALEIEVTSQWENHYNADVTVYNLMDEKMDNWMVALDFEDDIENIWNAEVIYHESSHYVIKNADWNQDIEAKGSVKFGMTVYCDDEKSEITECYDATDLSKYGEVCEASYTQFSRWGDMVNGQITIQNNSDEEIEDWRFEFTGDIEIQEIWNAKIIGQEKEYHYLENQSYNQNIAPGGEVSFGFIARCEDDLELSEYSVYGIKMWDQALEEDDDEEEEEAYFGETIWGPEDFERAEDYEAYLKSRNEYASYEYREDRPMLLNLEKGDTSFLEIGEECKLQLDENLLKGYWEKKISEEANQNENQNTGTKKTLYPQKGKAIQNFCMTDNYVYATQHHDEDTFLLRFKRSGKDNVTGTCVDAMLLRGFGHGQTLQRFKHGGKTYFLMTCKPYVLKDEEKKNNVTDFNFGTEIACIEYEAGAIINYETDSDKYGLIKNLAYATKTGKNYGEIRQVEAGLHSNKKLVIWKKKTDRTVQIVIYDFSDFVETLVKKGTVTFCSDKKDQGCIETKIRYKDGSEVSSVEMISPLFYKSLKNDRYFYPQAPGAHPSMQGIDLYGSSNIYMSSGRQSKSKLQLSRIQLKGKKIVKKQLFDLGDFSEIVSGSKKTKMELEGIQIDAKKVYVCVAPADQDGNGSKFPQSIMSLDRK
ncbi:MAG: hypothetical protein HFG36_01425 [Eubacterium sp.]|nr:hypothetical protein [Eubacterium sp.]